MRRQSVAAGLIRVVRHAEQESQAIGSAIPLQREAILRCREDLLALAARVKLEEPASSLGLTLAGELLTDVDSPLYQGSGDLLAATRKALAALGGADRSADDSLAESPKR
jgi:hypothetical protein